MTNIKKYLFQLLITFISLFVLTTLATTLYFFNLINPTTYNILKIVILLLTLFINSLILGKKAKCKGYLEGIKLSSIIIIIFMLLTLLFTKSFDIKYIIYYLIIIITSILGSMIGISLKKEL